MNTRILMASFFLVFLAELGDKTQLTALAFSTSSRSPWSVFLGTSLALICTTALAVLCGEALSRVVPQRVLQLASAVMFVLVGLVLLVHLARQGAPAQAEPVQEGAVQPTGPLALFVARQAVAFEEDLVSLIRESVADVTDAAVRDRLMELERRHSGHAEKLGRIGTAADGSQVDEMSADLAGGEPQRLLQGLARAGGDAAAQDAVARIIARQEAAAEFYIALAKLIRFHEVRDLLRSLAMEEIRLAQELCALVNHDGTASA